MELFDFLVWDHIHVDLQKGRKTKVYKYTIKGFQTRNLIAPHMVKEFSISFKRATMSLSMTEFGTISSL